MTSRGNVAIIATMLGLVAGFVVARDWRPDPLSPPPATVQVIVVLPSPPPTSAGPLVVSLATFTPTPAPTYADPPTSTPRPPTCKTPQPGTYCAAPETPKPTRTPTPRPICPVAEGGCWWPTPTVDVCDAVARRGGRCADPTATPTMVAPTSETLEGMR